MPLPYSDMQLLNWAHIENGRISLDGKSVLIDENVLEAAYSEWGLEHPKFHKMDGMAKAATIVVECLLRKHKTLDPDVALVFSTTTSSLDSDMQHEAALRKKLASPAVFVYTLPNIMLGELAIKHKWQGEQICLITPKPDARVLHQQADVLLATGKSRQVIIGHVDVGMGQTSAYAAILSNGHQDARNRLTFADLKKNIDQCLS